jgi:hypothetical protein
VHSVTQHAGGEAGITTTTIPKAAQGFISNLVAATVREMQNRATRQVSDAFRVLVMMSAALLGGAGTVLADPAPQESLAQLRLLSLETPLKLAIPAADAPAGDRRGQGTGDADSNPQPHDWVAEGRACDGCPPRSVGRALFQSTIINVLYGAVNLMRGHDTAKITPKSWWGNMEHGWVWDLNDFPVNQVGHPYQGNNYFTTGRSNGLSFYESAAVAAFGSGTWEYFGETTDPSLNDFINTTLGGIALGEMFYRTAWLVRNTRATGRGRMWSEIGATALDPMGGYNRFRTGDASRLHDKPADLVPSALGASASLGVLWRGAESGALDAAEGHPFLEMDLLYGDTQTGHSRTPYDAFAVRLRFGGGSAFSEARVRGRLLGQPSSNGKLHFSVLQSYDYQNNNAYATGSQSIDAALGLTQQLTSRLSLWVVGWGGLTVLGAIDSLPLDLSEVPEEDQDESHGPANQTGPRFYDYGPGGNFGVIAQISRDRRTFAVFGYEGHHLYSLDGVRANHFLQRARLDLLLPLRGALGFGASAEYFDRHTFYQDEASSERRYHYPQVRAYFTWSLE